ncbi:MAG: hypothetical protein EOO81_06935 [Oxalobacteraceae bacterium]|nr:MAG: hypothetical protein EOO81_06935 [Oxalobacteraceae bacterium]
MSLNAERVGTALSKLSEGEFLAVLGMELQRRGLALGELPKPRGKQRRSVQVTEEQLPLILPVVDRMRDT